MNVPVIGVVPLFDFVKSSVWMIPGYIDGLDEAGAAPVILPYTEAGLRSARNEAAL